MHVHKVATLISCGALSSKLMTSFRKVSILSSIAILAIVFVVLFSSVSISFGYAPTSRAVTGSSFVYVSNAGSNSVSVINGTKRIKTISVGSFPIAQMAYSPDNHELFVTDYGFGNGTNVSVINTTANKVIKTIHGFDGPSSAVYVPLDNAVYVSNFGNNQVFEVNVTTLKTVHKISVGMGPELSMFNPVNRLVYVSNAGSSTVSVINPATNKMVKTLTGVSSPDGIAFDPANNDTYVASTGSSSVLVYNLANKLVKTITGFSFPWYFAYNPLNKEMYLTDASASSVYVINSTSNKVVRTIFGFSEPYDIAFNPSNGLMYVANFGANNVQTINGYKLGRTITVGTDPVGVIVVPLA